MGCFGYKLENCHLVKAPSQALDRCAVCIPNYLLCCFQGGSFFYLISTLGILLDVVILSKSVDFVSPLRMILTSVLPSYFLKMPSKMSANDGKWSLSVRR